MGKKFEVHDFYCIQCGKSQPLARTRNNAKEKFHRKRLWCPWCGIEINHIECRNYEERLEFKEAFERGDFINESEESKNYISTNRSTR